MFSFPGGGKAFNWLTQSSMDTFTESTTFRGDSQLLFTVGTGPKASTKPKGKSWASRERKTATVKIPTGASTSRDTTGSSDIADGKSVALGSRVSVL